MFSKSPLDRITSIVKSFPDISSEARQQLLKLVGAQLHKVDVVSAEEFTVQRKSLEKTRELVAQLEARIAELESRLGTQHQG